MIGIEGNQAQISVCSLLNKIAQKKKEVVEKVKGKDVIMVVGYTGAGKSTICRAILGKNMTVYCDEEDQYHIKNDEEDEMDAQSRRNILVSHTKQLQLTTIKQDLVLIDCPGFCDTRGYDYDILNCESIRTALGQNRSIKIVLTISRMTLQQEKYQKLRILIRNLAFIYPEVNQSSFIISVTHASDGWSQKKVKNKLKKVLKQLKDLSDATFEQTLQCKMYEFMIEKSDICVIKSPTVQGPFQIQESIKKKIITFGVNSENRLNVQAFNFISSESKNKILYFINDILEEKQKIQKQNIEQQIALKELDHILEQIEKGILQPEKALKLLKPQIIPNGGLNITSSTGISYFIGSSAFLYASIFFIIFMGFKSIKQGIVYLFKYFSQQKQRREKAKKQIESIRDFTSKAIQGCNTILKNLDNLIELCRNLAK